MTPIALLILLFGQGPIHRQAQLRIESDEHKRGREARFNASTGRWQIYDGGVCVGEVETRTEAVTRVTDPSACLAMGPDRTIQT